MIHNNQPAGVGQVWSWQSDSSSNPHKTYMLVIHVKKAAEQYLQDTVILQGVDHYPDGTWTVIPNKMVFSWDAFHSVPPRPRLVKNPKIIKVVKMQLL